MLDLLASTVPKPGEPDLRGFEWYYWRKQAHGERTVRKLPGLGERARIGCRRFSPDGSLAASVDASTGPSRSRTLLVYETATGRLLHKIPLELPSPYRILSSRHSRSP